MLLNPEKQFSSRVHMLPLSAQRIFTYQKVSIKEFACTSQQSMRVHIVLWKTDIFMIDVKK
jgi:hypothetical protein